MVPALQSAEDIDACVDALLRRADAYGRYPTPVDDLVAASGLTEAHDFILDEDTIALAPARLRDMLRSAREKVLGLVDRRARVIHVSPQVEMAARRGFVKLHEVSHHVLPWQRDLLYADDDESLSPATRARFEREANHGAAQLLFQCGDLAHNVADLPVGLDSVEVLARLYGASMRATFRRYGEQHPAPIVAVTLPPAPDAVEPRRWRHLEVSASPSWRARFGPPRWPTLMDPIRFPFLAVLDGLGLDSVPMTDLRGDQVVVRVAARRLQWNSLLLLWAVP